MATEYATVEVVVAVDGQGDYAVGKDEDAALSAYSEDVTAEPTYGLRFVRLKVKVPLPVALELHGEVTADESQTGLTVN